jgi:hypothetical protein
MNSAAPYFKSRADPSTVVLNEKGRQLGGLFPDWAQENGRPEETPEVGLSVSRIKER